MVLSYIFYNKINKSKGMGLSKQSWNLVKKIKEVDKYIRDSNETIIFESHPEIIFQIMKKDKIFTKKKNEDGIIERRNLLEKNLSAKDSFYKKDDFIDACSLFWSANRTIASTEIKIPNDILFDSEGIIMQIRV